MTRSETIRKMMNLANSMAHNYTWEKYCKLWEMASEWNSNHEEREEIFMCEFDKEDGYEEDGVMIEDDLFYIYED